MSVTSRSGGRRDESGALAIFAAFVALLIFAFAALAVDLGNAVARKGDTQIQADFAALAGAEHLPGTESATDPAVAAVASYAWANRPQDDRDSDWAGSTSDIANNLVDGDDANGEVYFPTDGEVRVVSPSAEVNFGFAGIFSMFGGNSIDDVEVASDAVAALGTPKGYGVWPMYVAAPTPSSPGCDYGLQTLTDPPNGHSVPPSVPTLYADDHTNDNALDEMLVYDGGVPAASIDLDSTTGQIRISGDFKSALRVGFFRSDDPTATPIQVNQSEWLDTSPLAGSGPYTENNASILVAVPTAVTAVDTLWYVRVYQGGTGATADKWSARPEALPLSIGDAPFECVGGSSDGNFGTLKMPRSTSNSAGGNGWISRNIALGLEPPLSLTKFPGDPAPWICDGHPDAVITTSGADLKSGTNCLDTDTGLTDGTATPGFITGYSGPGSPYPGLLATGSSSEDPDGSGGCSPSGDTSPISLGGKSLNNDLLTCFLTDSTTALGDIARRNYAGGPVLDPAIYNSPRFGWVPVFAQETESGGSGHYSIINFRPVFLTDQPMTATKANSAINSTTANGLGVTTTGSFKLHTIKVVFLNPNALPDGDAATPIGPLLDPDLPTVIRLTD